MASGPQLLWADLISIPDRGGFLHVRAVRDGERLLAVAVVPSDNPGGSPANRYEPLQRELAARLGREPDVVLIAFPQFVSNRWLKVPPGGLDYSDRSSDREAALLAGSEAAALPPVDACSCADLAPGHPLLAELTDPESPRSPLDDLVVVEVGALPWPHKPFRCRHSARFEELSKTHRVATGDAGARWFASLTRDDAQACRYHRLDWAEAAGAAVEVLGAGPTSIDEVREVIAGRSVADAMARAILSFFRDPICWTPGTPYLTNGQHRLCAVRFAGATVCVVDTAGVVPAMSVLSEWGPLVGRSASMLARRPELVDVSSRHE